MSGEEWLPSSNDTRSVLAAAFNAFFKNGEVQVIPSAIPVSTPYEQIPETINAFGTLEVTDITAEQATNIHGIIHAPGRAFNWNSGSTSYMWPTRFSFVIHLVRRNGEMAFRVLFPILYSDRSDIDAILAIASNQPHQSFYQALGLQPSQLSVSTYVYNEEIGWSPRS